MPEEGELRANLFKLLLGWAAIWAGIYGVVCLLEPGYPEELLTRVGAAAWPSASWS